MTDQTHIPGTALRNPADREMIPKALVRAMFALALASLAIVSFAVVTGRDTVGQPKPAEILTERQLVLEGGGAKAVRVLAPGGEVLADLAHGGFITVIQNGLARERMKQGVEALKPVTLIAYANGRLTLSDPETGWSAELASFGDENKAAFERLMTN